MGTMSEFIRNMNGISLEEALIVSFILLSKAQQYLQDLRYMKMVLVLTVLNFKLIYESQTAKTV